MDCLPVRLSIAMAASAKTLVLRPGNSSIEFSEFEVLLQNEPILASIPKPFSGSMMSWPFQRPPTSSLLLTLNTFKPFLANRRFGRVDHQAHSHRTQATMDNCPQYTLVSISSTAAIKLQVIDGKTRKLCLCMPNQPLILVLLVDLVFAVQLRSSLRENPRAS